MSSLPLRQDAPALDCLICCSSSEHGEHLLRTGCRHDHYICQPCLVQLFDLAAKNEYHYPPSCCNLPDHSMVIDDFKHVLPSKVYRKFKQKEQEYLVEPRLRRYCANPGCSELFYTTELNGSLKNVIFCAHCNSATCIRCKRIVNPDPLWKGKHPSNECHKSEDDMALEDFALYHNFKKCFNCHQLVELSEACNHITCPCGGEFCYICGREWTGPHSCPIYGQPVFDAEGYNQDGFHRDARLNRHGFSRQEQLRYDQNRFDGNMDDVDDIQDRSMHYVNNEGNGGPGGQDFERLGINPSLDIRVLRAERENLIRRQGYFPAGYDLNRYDRDGYDQGGYGRDDYNRGGHNRRGFNRDGYDIEGFNQEGLDEDGFDRSGYNNGGYDREGYDRNGYDSDGFNKNGVTKFGFCKDSYLYASFIHYDYVNGTVWSDRHTLKIWPYYGIIHWAMDRNFPQGASDSHHLGATYKTSFNFGADGVIQAEIMAPGRYIYSVIVE